MDVSVKYSPRRSRDLRIPYTLLQLVSTITKMSKKEVQISSYSKKLRDNVKAILDNYGEILKAAKVSSVDS